MQAIGYQGQAGLDTTGAFRVVDRETPTPTGHDLLVQVTAVSINPIDSKIRQRTAEPQDSLKILGWDAAGVVEAVGEQVSDFAPGDRVYYAGDVRRDGCNASHQLVDERIVGRAPTRLSDLEAAAMPLTSITAWEALFDRMRIDPARDAGRSILIIGGAGGVGSVAIQLAKQVAKLDVVTTASRAATVDWCTRMGADQVLNHREDLVQQFQQRQLALPDYILCLNDTDAYFDHMVELIAPQGLICALVDTQKTHDLNALKMKSAGFVWEFMFTRPIFDTRDICQQQSLLNEVAQLLDQGVLKSTLQLVLEPLSPEALTDAHRRIESGATIGKMVLPGLSAACSP